ncbi:hypothetical protein HXX76_010419 [Chlamydomonas incerta]|uniref:Ankyrin repeat domain-containing protein n=1 Tax=Chlamydomonas incerta TaxID=51695 RepID=A0A835SU09_CHLIN|nr:hypothetical protein HXX76_010419 [Chlamydomonas incerta]|eukprot:KAG2428269.1 hypothetical protein HXX76_010419 [Chlamydomonas incerta]
MDPWARLTPDLVREIAGHVHANERAWSLKVVNSSMARLFKEYQTLQLIEGCSDSWPGHAFVAHWGRAEPWRALTLPQRERLLCLAASSGHAASLDAALAQCGCALKPKVLTAAAAAGNLAGCERLLRDGCSFSTDAITAAARGGHMPTLELLLSAIASGDNFTDSYLAAAAQGACAGRQLSVLAWLQQAHGYSPRLPDAEAAARAGQVAMLEQLLMPLLLLELGVSEEQPEPAACAARWRLLIAIAEGCPVAVLQRHYDSLWRLPRGAARGFSELDLMKAALRSPTPCWAAKVEFLRSACWGPAVVAGVRHGGLCSVWKAAAERPDFLARLKLLRAAGVCMDTSAAMVAAQSGHADALAWLWDEAGVPAGVTAEFSNPYVVRSLSGNVGVLGLLRDRGVVFDARHVAVVSGFRWPGAAMLWLVEAVEGGARHGGGGGGGGRRPAKQEQRAWSGAFATFASSGSELPLLRTLRARGASVDLGAVAERGSEEALEWAAAELEAGAAAPLSSEQAQEVFTAGNKAALAWLHRRGLLPPASEYLPALEHADEDMVPSRFWRLQLRAQLEADAKRKDGAERSVWAGFLARARAAASDVAVTVAAEAAAAQPQEPQGPAQEPVQDALLPHQLAWLQHKADSCPRPS